MDIWHKIEDNMGLDALKALEIIQDCGQVDGAHHKTWIIDQVVRLLTRDLYDEFITEWEGEEGARWDVGIAP